MVLAGDIGVGTDGIAWAQRAIPDRPVVYVLGNHEFYGQDFERLIQEARACAAGSQGQLLENNTWLVPWGDRTLRVLGCSLWTDFALFGEDRLDHRAADCQDIDSSGC